MTTRTSTSLVPVANYEAPAAKQGCCGTGSGTSSRSRKWLMLAAAALAVLGLVTGSLLLGFAAIAPLLYALPCLLMCGMCLFGKKGQAASN